MAWLGLDIGGANLKAANGNKFAISRGFALWQHPEKLEQELRALIADAPKSDHLIATMTGEIADCYESKSEGVAAIVAALEQAADGRHTRVYLTSGKMVTTEVARRRTDEAAASNWHALASFVCRLVPEGSQGLLIDIGSTTTDIIRLDADGPISESQSDTQRLGTGELIYTGVRRSPVCGVSRRLPYRGNDVPAAQELFATMQDVYVLLGQLAEDPTSKWTADGRPLTKKYCRARMARMICADSTTFNHQDAVTIAKSCAQDHEQQILDGVHQVWQLDLAPDVVVTSGSGEFLAQQVVQKAGWEKAEIKSLKKKLGSAVSMCATAHAIAVLAHERSES